MTATRLTDEQRIDWLLLIRADGIGPRTCRTLIEQLGDAAAVLDALPRLGQGGRPVKVPDRGEAVREMERAARLGVRFIALCEPDYPHTLRVVDSAPPLIGLRGTAAILARPMVAIVGSRNASAAGLALTERLARDVGAAGFVIVSGLARGIDARAHRGALGSGTVAVLAGGHDRVYPAENEGLLDAILAQGGAALGPADHRALCPRAGPGGVRGAGLAARSARRGNQRPHPRRRDPVRRRRARDQRAGATRRPAAGCGRRAAPPAAARL
jgi:DNA processing protein